MEEFFTLGCLSWMLFFHLRFEKSLEKEESRDAESEWRLISSPPREGLFWRINSILYSSGNISCSPNFTKLPEFLILPQDMCKKLKKIREVKKWWNAKIIYKKKAILMKLFQTLVLFLIVILIDLCENTNNERKEFEFTFESKDLNSELQSVHNISSIPYPLAQFMISSQV